MNIKNQFAVGVIAVVVTCAIALPIPSSAKAKIAKATTTTAAPITAPSTTVPSGTPVKSSAVFDPATVTSAAEECRQSGPDPKGICARIGFAPMTFSGDIAGTALFASSVSASPVGVGAIVGTFVFMPDSKIASCGAGAFVIQFGPAPKGTPSPSRGPDRPDFWRIVSTSGSSPLATTNGEGLIWAEPVAGSALVTARLTGRVQC